jgi:hypothetical protein
MPCGYARDTAPPRKNVSSDLTFSVPSVVHPVDDAVQSVPILPLAFHTFQQLCYNRT